MSLFLTVSTATINPIPLDLEYNSSLILNCINKAKNDGSNLVLLPELSLTGYGCEDMFYVQDFLHAVPSALKKIMEQTPEGIFVSIGIPVKINGQIYNACALLDHTKIYGITCKQYLARTGIHYENRWFTPWQAGVITTLTDFLSDQEEEIPVGDVSYELNGIRIGYEICEDSWVAHRPGINLYSRGIDVILNPSASHFALGKHQIRRDFIADGSRAFCSVYAYTNLLGNEAGRAIYDGDSMIASCGKIVKMAERLSFKHWEVYTATVDITANRNNRILSSENKCQITDVKMVKLPHSITDENLTITPNLPPATPEDEHLMACRAVALGMWDFMRKTYTGGFALSLSGGADSALCGMMVYYAMVQAACTLKIESFVKILKDCRINIQDIPQIHTLQELIDFVKKSVMPNVLITLYQGSDHSGDITKNAASNLASDIGSKHFEWSISNLVSEYHRLVNSLLPENEKLSWEKDDITLQNIQARSRSPGVWMLANKYNKLLLATSNLSEASVGYCTMDGDTSGVLSPIAGISKSRILKINEYIFNNGLKLQDTNNAEDKLQIPNVKYIIDQKPTAELRPVEQTDESDLMPYPLLDEIRKLTQTMNFSPVNVLNYLINGTFGDIYDRNYLYNAVKKYYRLYCRNQWKRERIAVGFHIESDSADPKTFRRFPVLSSMLKREMKELDEMADHF